MDQQTPSAIDYVAIDKDEHLLVEFAATGLSKHFSRVTLKSIEHSYSKNYAHSVYVEMQEGEHCKLMIESQEFDYSGKPKLRQYVIEQFKDASAAQEALTKVKFALGVGNVAEKESTSLTTSKGVERFFIVMIAVCCLALSSGGIGAAFGGYAIFNKFYVQK